MTNLLDSIKKYGVYVVLLAAVIYNFGALVPVVPWWTPETAIIVQIDTILGFLGLGSIRAKLADAFAGIDLGPVGTWLTGKKTYIISIAVAAFNLGSLFLGWTPETPWIAFLNALLGALGVGTFTTGLMTYKAQVLKMYPMAASAFKKFA